MAAPLAGRTVVLGVTGSIAAFKVPHVVSRLTALGANVVVVMTANATRFVAPLTFETLSGNEVITDMWPERKAGVAPVEEAVSGRERLRHVHLAEAASLAIVAPATANIIGKFATGVADDFLSTELLAMACPIIVAPAMNVNMMESAAVTENLETLRRRGVIVVEPEVGRLASGAVGRGRLADPEDILRAALGVLLPPQDLAGKRVLVTAGPTEEPIDPVRHVGNPSTGTMGYAIAERAVARGADVVLVSGPTALAAPAGLRFVRVRTTREMRDAVLAELPETDLVVMAAAPADYRPVSPSAGKIKKTAPKLTLELERTEDILSEVAKAKRPGVGVVGFALETDELVANAKRKLAEKELDLIVANDPTVEGAGFGTGTNVVTIVGRSGAVEPVAKLPKLQLSDIVLSRAIAELGWGGR